MLVRYSTIQQYILLYFLLIFQGTILFREYNDIILIAVICIFFLGVIRFKRYYSDLDRIGFGLSVLLLLVLLFTFGSLGVSSILANFSRIAIVSLAYIIDREKFAERFVKIIVFFAVISLIFFAVQCVDANILSSFMKQTAYEVEVSYGKVNWTLYSTPFFQFNNTTLRNIGICNEPGLYQILLVSALYVVMFKGNALRDVTESQKKRYMIILLVTLATTLSLTGYANMLFLLACYFLLPTTSEDISIRRAKRLLAVLLIILSIALANGMASEIIDKNIFEKLNRISLSADAEESRLVSAFADLNVAIRHPFGAGFDVYHQEWKSFVIADIIDGASCVGLTQWMAVYGFIPTFYLLIMLIRLAIRNNTYAVQTIALLAIYINTCCAQPNMLFPALLALFIIDDQQYEMIGELND